MLRFGRKMPLPSTAQIKHEMRLMSAVDDLAAAVEHSGGEPLSAATIRDMAVRNGISEIGVDMLVDRLCGQPATV